MKHLLLISITLISLNSLAQPYVEGGNTRHRFAQLNLGADTRMFSGNGSFSSVINPDGEVESFALKSQSEARVIIGGTHFWGHADFYIAIPVASFGKSGFSTGVETGAKYYPWRIEHGKIRPYIGTALLPTEFKQGNGAILTRFKAPILGGFSFNYKNSLFELGAGFNYSTEDKYYINTNTAVKIKTQPFWISLGYKYMLETTLSSEKDWISGRTKKLTDTLASLHRLNGFTFGIGPSVAFFLGSSSHNQKATSYLDNHKTSNLFPDLGLGYYLHKPDIQFNLAFRTQKSTLEAYGFSQTASRRSLTFEVYKFFMDYNGFAAFVGPALSYESLKVTETDQLGATTSQSFSGVRPGITFGWDIRPNRIQSWYLRTNLRYFPGMKVRTPDGESVNFNQLEVNFIQLVVFPGRMF